MLAHLVAICWPMLAYVGLSCGQRGPILWLCWTMFAACWPMLSQKIRKMGTATKRCKTQDILMVGGLSWPIFRALWAHLGAILAHLGAMLAHLGGYVSPSWGYVGPSWGLCWPILRLCSPILRPMLARLDPSWATRSEK